MVYVCVCFVCISEGMLLLLTSQKKKLRKIFFLACFLSYEGGERRRGQRRYAKCHSHMEARYTYIGHEKSYCALSSNSLRGSSHHGAFVFWEREKKGLHEKHLTNASLGEHMIGIMLTMQQR